MDFFDFYLPYATKKEALQIYAHKHGSNFGTETIKKRVTTREELDAFIAEHKDKHLYFNCSLMRKAETGRGDGSHAAIMPGFYADIDTADGEHSGDRPTKQQVADMLKSGDVVPPPSVIIGTGGGFHCYWMFATPWVFKNEKDQQLAASWLTGLNDRIKKWCVELDPKFKYERLKDLARILRIPGSLNHKTDPPKDASQLFPKVGEEPKLYLPDALCFEPMDEDEFKREKSSEPCDVDSKTAVQVAMRACAKVEPEWGEDGSSYLLKLCRQCVRAGCTGDQTYGVVKGILVAMEDYPTNWSKKDILRRYEDATEQSELGEAVSTQLSYENSEFGVARRVVDRSDGKFFYVPEWKKWIGWDGKRFAIDQVRQITDTTVAVSKDMMLESDEKAWIAMCNRYQSNRGFTDIRNIIKDYIKMPFKQLDADSQKFHCDNGVLHFVDGEVKFSDHNPEYLNSVYSPIKYAPGAECPKWEQFCRETFVTEDGESDEDLMRYMQKVAGLCLTGRTDFQSVFILYGEGKNGKGCYCRTLGKLLGDYGIPVRQEVLMAAKGEHPTALADLYGRRAIFAGETDQDCRLNENQVKTLSGDDPISCRRMREDTWTFQPTHKIILATNHLPLIRGTDYGIWRRIRLIPFNAQFMSEDKTLEAVDIPNELSGILNWAIEGYQMLEEEGLQPPEIVLAANKHYQEDMNIVRQFVEDECVLTPDATITNGRLYQSFKTYCETLGQWVPSHRKLTQDLSKMGVKSKNANSERFKIGIGLKSEFEDVESEKAF